MSNKVGDREFRPRRRSFLRESRGAPVRELSGKCSVSAGPIERRYITILAARESERSNNSRDTRRVSSVPIACVKRVNGEVNDGERKDINKRDSTIGVECLAREASFCNPGGDRDRPTQFNLPKVSIHYLRQFLSLRIHFRLIDNELSHPVFSNCDINCRFAAWDANASFCIVSSFREYIILYSVFLEINL